MQYKVLFIFFYLGFIKICTKFGKSVSPSASG